MKTTRKLLSLALFVTLLTALACTASAESSYDLTGCEPLKVLFPCPNGATALDTVYTEKWMGLVTERSGGLITFDYTNSGALGSPAELMDGVDMGAYDMSVIDLANFDSYVPQVDVLCLPYIIKNYEHAQKVYGGAPFTWVSGLVGDKMNVVMLNTFLMGFRDVLSKDPLTTLDDCKDYLIRSPAVELYLEALGRLGFSCTTISYSEMYSAMSAGIIDAVETTLNVLYESGYYDLGKYILATRHFFACSQVIANTEFWAGLPDVYKQIMTDALDEVVAEEWAYSAQMEEHYKALFEEKGVTVTELSDEDHAKILAIFDDYWKERAASMGEGAAEMLATLIALQD